jgi:hypothetical protein
MDACFANGVCLAGYTIDQYPIAPGVIYVTLFWRPTRLLDDSMGLFVHLINHAGAVIAQDNAVPTRNYYPGAEWSVGELIPDVRILTVPSGLASGKARFEVGVSGSEGGQRLPIVDSHGTKTADLVRFGALDLTPGKETGPAATQPGGPAGLTGQKLPLRFGDGIVLESYDVTRAAQPGDSLSVTLHWRASGRVDKDYSVFVHLLDQASGAILAQGDHQPDAGNNPTSWWVPGEEIADRLTLAVPAGAQDRHLALRVGMYSLADGKRLPASAASGAPAGDSVDLGIP